MAPALVKRWFLVALVAGCVLAWFAPGALAWTLRMPPRVVMPLALFLVAWTLESRHLARAVRRPGAALWGVFVGYTVPPLLGWAAGSLLPSDFQIGLLVCTAVPCTLASAALWTRLAGGDEATAILGTAVSTGVSWAATTAWLAVTTGRLVALNYPAMMLDLAVTLVLPVALAQAARAAPPLARFATNFKRPLGVGSRLLVLLILLRAARDVSVQLHADSTTVGPGVLLLAAGACLGTHLVALFAGLWSARRLGFARPAQIAAALVGSQKTLPVSLVLLDLYFPGCALAMVPMLFYHLGQLTLDTLIAERWAAGNGQPSE
jgi:sodium/bile acid cotransporter 7